jgi:hypothetical protein
MTETRTSAKSMVLRLPKLNLYFIEYSTFSQTLPIRKANQDISLFGNTEQGRGLFIVFTLRKAEGKTHITNKPDNAAMNCGYASFTVIT